jgi:hypothetical protein
MRFAGVASWLLLTGSAWAQEPVLPVATAAQMIVSAPNWPLEVESVRTALEQSPTARTGIRRTDLELARITLPPDFTTRARNAPLEFRRIQDGPEHETVFATLRCRERSACGSFLVEISLPNAKPGRTSDGKMPAAISSLSTPEVHRGITPGPALVQPHIPARLVMEEDGLRITESVLPLKQARLGETLRVIDQMTHRSMLVEVVGPGLVRAVGQNTEAGPRGMR